jgi:sugar lactone lactonase YvrE
VILGVAEPVSPEAAELGEGTRWDGARGELLWVDLLAGILRTAVPDGAGRLTTTAERRLDVPVGAAAPLADGSGWVLAAGDGFALLSRAGDVRWLDRPEAANDGATRMNDGACDPSGRFWAGSMAYDETPGAGSLYRLDESRAATVLDGVTISNGLGWSPDGRTMYYADTGAATIDAFSFDVATGALADRRTLVSGEPADGLTVDDEGFIWAAIWGAGEVRRYSPGGGLAGVVRVPASQVTCCCFGGADRRTLFISTAAIGLSADEPDAGRVFAFRAPVAGPAASCATRVGSTEGTGRRSRGRSGPSPA